MYKKKVNNSWCHCRLDWNTNAIYCPMLVVGYCEKSLRINCICCMSLLVGRRRQCFLSVSCWNGRTLTRAWVVGLLAEWLVRNKECAVQCTLPTDNPTNIMLCVVKDMWKKVLERRKVPLLSARTAYAVEETQKLDLSAFRCIYSESDDNRLTEAWPQEQFKIACISFLAVEM